MAEYYQSIESVDETNRPSIDNGSSQGDTVVAKEDSARPMTDLVDGQAGTTSQEKQLPGDLPDPLRRRPTLRTQTSSFEPNDPVQLERLQSAKSIQDEVSGPRRRKSRADKETLLPPFGGGKDYPPTPLDQELYMVDFDGSKDPLHPHNWPLLKKIVLMAVLGFSTFVVAWGSSSFSPSTVAIKTAFGVGEVVSVLPISLYVFGFASGPLVWAPLSEMYGRKFPILLSTFVSAIFQIGVARSPDIQTLTICRFFAGFFGASCLAVVPAAFTDIFGNKARGMAIAIFASMVFTGPIIAPAVNAFIVASYLGWRWTAYLTSIMGFGSTILVAFFMEETYAPEILVSKAKMLRRETGNWCIMARQERSDFNLSELVEHNLSRPLRMLFTEPILFLITLYTAFIYGILYLLLEAYPIIFLEGYGMPFAVSFLPYFGIVVGQVFGGLMVISFEPYTYRRIMANGGRPIPELRLLPTMIGAVLFTIGLFWLTWTGAYPQSVPWIVPTLAGILIGAGLISIFLTALNYVIESYLMFAASAVAANTFLRSAFGGAFPLFATAMFHNLGVQWAGTLLGCIALILIPVPVVFYLFGKRLRVKSRFAPT